MQSPVVKAAILAQASNPLSLSELALIQALRAIVTEAMDYPPVRPYDSSSFLPAHLTAQAQTALAAYGLSLEPSPPAADGDDAMTQAVMNMVSGCSPQVDSMSVLRVRGVISVRPPRGGRINTIIFSAPQAWGKTHNARILQRHFGCARVVDNWQSGDATVEGALHLTNIPPGEIDPCYMLTAELVSKGWQEGGAA